jgi:FimV-like protein
MITTLLSSICTWKLGVGNAADAYTTTRGDTLWEIARRYVPDDTISTHQVMLALWRANPEAFVGNNMHRLKAGYVLHIPARDVMLASRREDAIAEVIRQQISPFPPEVPNESGVATSPESPVSATETHPASLPETTSTDAAGTTSEASAQDIVRLRHNLALAQEQATQHQTENEALRVRVMTLEEKLTKLDDLIAMQQERFDKPPQHPAGAAVRDPAPAPSTAGYNDTAAMTPPTFPRRMATWLTVPSIVMVISGIGLLGLALLGLRARRAPANVAPDEIAARRAQQVRDAQPSAAEDEELEPNRAAETPLADLMIDLDDLDLGPDQGEESVGLGSAGTTDAAAEGAGSVDRTGSPSRPNAASMPRKAEEASSSNTC